MALLTVSGITKKIDKDTILNNVSFTQQKLQHIAIVGETGAGKSTLLKTIAGLVQPTKGEVLLEKERVQGPEEKLVPGHPHIGFLSQHFELQKFLRVEQVLQYSDTLPEGEATHLFDLCRITHLLKRKTDQLSGGEKQRIALANLLLASPTLLLLDEPFSNLDRHHKTILQAVIEDISQKLNITTILVSHDPDDILYWADKILVLRDGKILQSGTPEKIYRQPADEYTAGLFGKYSVLTTPQKNVLFEHAGLKKGKNNRFFRPEDLRIISRKKGSLRGKVVDINNYGSHHEACVDVDGNTIVVKIPTRTVENGDNVFVSLSPAYIAAQLKQ